MAGPELGDDARRVAARGRAGQIRPEPTTSERDELADLVRQLSVTRGRFTLTSGKEAGYYVDLRRATLHHRAAPLIGRLIRELTGDWEYSAVGGLTLGADPVATAVMHAPGRPIDAFVVRKSVKTHGMQRLIEGADVSGRRVLVVEDTSTTGASALFLSRSSAVCCSPHRDSQRRTSHDGWEYLTASASTGSAGKTGDRFSLSRSIRRSTAFTSLLAPMPCLTFASSTVCAMAAYAGTLPMCRS